MEKDWVAVYKTNEEYLAYIAKGVLKENDIDSIIVNKNNHSYHFGDIELHVNRNLVIRAKFLLKNLEA